MDGDVNFIVKKGDIVNYFTFLDDKDDLTKF